MLDPGVSHGKIYCVGTLWGIVETGVRCVFSEAFGGSTPGGVRAGGVAEKDVVAGGGKRSCLCERKVLGVWNLVLPLLFLLRKNCELTILEMLVETCCSLFVQGVMLSPKPDVTNTNLLRLIRGRPRTSVGAQNLCSNMSKYNL